MITIIMAGGLGKRMKSSIPKVLHEIVGKPMICHVIDRALEIGSKLIYIVVGKYKKEIEETVSSYFPSAPIKYIIQEEPLGTGHCIQCCMEELNNDKPDKVLILSGDVPIITKETLEMMVIESDQILVVEKTNPYGYGRMIMKNNYVLNIIEEKDCNTDEKLIKTVNCGIYCVSLETLNKTIFKIVNNNVNKEYYLPDIVKFHNKFTTVNTDTEAEVFNINSPEDMILAKDYIRLEI